MRPISDPWRLSCLILTVLLAAATSRADAAGTDQRAILLDEDASVAWSRQAIDREVTDLTFTTTEGRTIRLAAFRGRPLLLSMVYTSCEDICPVSTERLAEAVQASDATLGPDRYGVLTIGFDSHGDTPARLRDWRAAHHIDRSGWVVAGGDQESIDRLAADTGFLFAPRAGGFDHMALTTVIDADGKVYRQIYGAGITEQDLVRPLRQLLTGQREPEPVFSSLFKKVRLLCTLYDPALGRYRVSYAILITITIGAASLGAVALSIVRMWRTRRA